MNKEQINGITSMLNNKVNLKENILIQELAGESVLLNLDREEYFGLDKIATEMLSVLKESASIQIACDRLVQNYAVEPEEIRQDVLDLVEKLINHGLVKVTNS